MDNELKEYTVCYIFSGAYSIMAKNAEKAAESFYDKDNEELFKNCSYSEPTTVIHDGKDVLVL